MSVQFISHGTGGTSTSYDAFKTMATRFQPSFLDVIYRDSPGASTFSAWAFDYARHLAFYLTLEQGAYTGVPATFLADFPQAVAVPAVTSDVFLINFFS